MDGEPTAAQFLTEQKPDLIIIDRSVLPAKVGLLELMVPWDSFDNFKAAY